VIVKNGAVVGRGYHLYEERDHAEIVALRQAGREARGSTLYVNLEPCCHTGRTGPCTKAIIDAGVRRVVGAMADPNPRVAGSGFAQLRKAGIRVSTDVEEDEAQRLNEDFAHWIRTGLPFVTLKAALTLDGQIAMRPGHETPITAEASREAVQRLRHSADALLTGIGTVLADNPLLTDRTGLRRRRKLLRVVMDSKLRLSPRSKFVRSADGDVLVVARQPPDRAAGRAADAKKSAALERAGVEVMRVGSAGGRVSLKDVLKEMGKRQIVNLLLEAGSELNGAAIAGGFVHKMFLFYAPKIMGTGGVPFAQIPSTWFHKAPSLSRLTLHGFGRDFAVEGYFQDVYRDNGTDGKD
jgi:diaminohydroxyphosphoribosylaminopyrimidine deaminase/5-amino-6-(5-phosphoribosylamino)uracil reductase